MALALDGEGAVEDWERSALIERLVDDRAAIFRAMRADWSKDVMSADLTFPQLRVLFMLEREGKLGYPIVAVNDAWRNRREGLLKQAEELTEHLQGGEEEESRAAPSEAAEKWLKDNPAVIDTWLDGVMTLSGEAGAPAVRQGLGL